MSEMPRLKACQATADPAGSHPANGAIEQDAFGQEDPEEGVGGPTEHFGAGRMFAEANGVDEIGCLADHIHAGGREQGPVGYRQAGKKAGLAVDAQSLEEPGGEKAKRQGSAGGLAELAEPAASAGDHQDVWARGFKAMGALRNCVKRAPVRSQTAEITIRCHARYMGWPGENSRCTRRQRTSEAAARKTSTKAPGTRK